MYQGFYDLASGMITQRRNLNTISNNMANVQTSGYKKDTMVSTTFKEEMMIRTGRYNKKNPEDLAMASRIKSAARTYTDYEQGSYETTDGIYDTALNGKGFFAVRTDKGTLYTRSGNFSVDENYEGLHKEDNNMFSTTQAELAKPADTTVNWKMLEKSNVDMVEEMTTMMSSQRSLQSAAQMLRMYDTVMSKASSDVGRI